MLKHHYAKVLLCLCYCLIILACNDQNNKPDLRPINLPEEPKIKHPPVQYAEFRLENQEINIADVAKIDGENEKTASFISQRIEKMVGEEMQQWTEAAGLTYPPKRVLFRVFKLEGELEVWGANNNKEAMRLIQTFPVCAVDRFPGPKLQEGDYKTPEGFYQLSKLYGSSLDFMWIKLAKEAIDEYGEKNEGSSFKLWLNYPNSVDKKRTKNVLGNGVKPGSEICMHGNCVSSGCVSMKNRIYMTIFAFANYHKASYGKPMIHIFPFRFSTALKDFYIDQYGIEDQQWIQPFWEDLELGYQQFEKDKKWLKVKEKNGRYVFGK